MSKKYRINTYGCQMNVHESEKLAGILRGFSYEPSESDDDADIIVLNTCCVRETAETHILGNLGFIKKLKEKKPSLKVAVCGCMTQQNGAAEKLKKRCPFIDIIFGTHNLHLFGEYLKALDTQKSLINVWQAERGINENTPVYRTSGLNAWVNIMYGCNNFCSYCIVPYVRGRERSREFSAIVDDVKKLTESGYKEITLLGQNVNSYGSDFDDKNINFAMLLERLSEINGKFRIKFMTSHPKDLSEAVVKTISGSEKISKFIHLPVQAGNDRILRLMNRGYTSADYLNKIELIRKYIPSAGLSSDIMVGFPSETEAEFLDTLKLVDEVKFNNIYTFIYSRRSGTKADLMDGQIDIKTKKDRIKRLIDEQFLISKNISGKYIGQAFEVLCETHGAGKANGKTDCGKVVTFNTSKDMYAEFVNIKVSACKNSNLFGEISEE